MKNETAVNETETTRTGQTQEEFWSSDQPWEKDFDLPPGWTREAWDMTEGVLGY